MTTPCVTQVIYGPDVEAPIINTATNVVLPLTGEYSLNTEVVYGDDDQQIAFYEHTLNVDIVLHLNYITSANTSVETEAARIRNILGRPGQQLKLNYVGVGEIATINVSQPDVKGGPFPQSVFVEPLITNQAISVRWSVMFRTVECGALGPNLIQYNIEQAIDVDDDGDVSYILNHTYQTASPMNIVDRQSLIDTLITTPGTVQFQGMRHTTQTNLSRDGRILAIRQVYKEIKSDSAFHPFVSNVQVEDKVSSSLLATKFQNGAGFKTWNRIISGSVSLPARVHKGYAWFVVLKILRARFTRLFITNKIANVIGLDPEPAPAVAEMEEDYYLPMAIEIVDVIYSRSIRFNCQYLVHTDLRNLIYNAKLFTRVNTDWVGEDEQSAPTTLTTQWQGWQNSRTKRIDGLFQYLDQNIPIVYNQCNGEFPLPSIKGSIESLPLNDDPDWDGGVPPSAGMDTAEDAANPEQYTGRTLTPEISWVNYENDFEIIEETNVMPVSFLEEPSAGYYKDNSVAYNARTSIDNVLSGRNTATETQTYPSTVVARGASTFYIRMKGHAIRLGYKIPYPFVISVAGKSAVRYKARVAQTQAARGPVPVYLAKWDIIYIIPGGDIYTADIMNTIKTTGAPEVYS